MLTIFKLMFNYWKRSAGVLFGFVFPLLSLLVFRSFIPLQAILPMMLISNSLGSGIFGLGITYADIRNSVIIKKIRTLPLPKWKVVSGIISFNFFISCLSNLWIFSFAALFFRSEINFSQINWLYLVLAVFLAITMASIIGFIIGSLASNSITAGNFAFLIMSFPVTFFSGQYIPISSIKNSDKLTLIAKSIPFSYPFDIIRRASLPDNLPTSGDNLLFTSYYWPVIFALIWIVSLLFLAFFVYQLKKE